MVLFFQYGCISCKRRSQSVHSIRENGPLYCRRKAIAWLYQEKQVCHTLFVLLTIVLTIIEFFSVGYYRYFLLT